MSVIQNRLPEEDRLSHTLRTFGRMIGWTIKTGFKLALVVVAAAFLFSMYSSHKNSEFKKDFASHAETYEQHRAHMIHPEFGLNPGSRERTMMHDQWIADENTDYEFHMAARSTAFSLGEQPDVHDMTNAELDVLVRAAQ